MGGSLIPTKNLIATFPLLKSFLFCIIENDLVLKIMHFRLYQNL